jgi:hypothetical protein
VDDQRERTERIVRCLFVRSLGIAPLSLLGPFISPAPPPGLGPFPLLMLNNLSFFILSFNPQQAPLQLPRPHLFLLSAASPSPGPLRVPPRLLSPSTHRRECGFAKHPNSKRLSACCSVRFPPEREGVSRRLLPFSQLGCPEHSQSQGAGGQSLLIPLGPVGDGFGVVYLTDASVLTHHRYAPPCSPVWHMNT